MTFDLEAKMFMLLFHLKEEKNKLYTGLDCNKNIVYVFDNLVDFKLYFVQNGINITKELLEICKIKETKNGSIIALKNLCDYVIKKCKTKHVLSFEQEIKYAKKI